MQMLDNVRLIIYRVNAKGLEILLMPNEMEKDKAIWGIPKYQLARQTEDMIWLEDDITDGSGEYIRSVAIEGDWHDIPSIRGIVKHDVKLVTSKIKAFIPQLENASYVSIKEAFKRVMPDEYKALKELKDIILDKNILTSI